MTITHGNTTTHATAILRPHVRRAVSQCLVAIFALLAGVLFAVLPAAAQGTAPHAASAATVKQVASDLYFFFDYNGSNAVFLVTDAGVLVIDTRTHPRAGQDLLDRIRKVTDKPIKWVINSHFHGDHHFGNAAFKPAGATFVAQKETARIMQQVQPKEVARRLDSFKNGGHDPNEVKLILPDVTFDTEMTIRLGGREIRFLYLGPGQQAGDTFVLFPHARVLFTPGAFARHSMPNMAFTPSVDNWIKLLDQVAATDVDYFLPAHGDVATRADVKELAAMLADEYATVKEAVAKGMSLEEAQKTLTFPQYKDWRELRKAEGRDQGTVRTDPDRPAKLFRVIRRARRLATLDAGRCTCPHRIHPYRPRAGPQHDHRGDHDAATAVAEAGGRTDASK
jgi:glyoxylase-like metal-dependent hydrolase (beta-lactamase superfamily II)